MIDFRKLMIDFRKLMIDFRKFFSENKQIIISGIIIIGILGVLFPIFRFGLPTIFGQSNPSQELKQEVVELRESNQKLTEENTDLKVTKASLEADIEGGRTSEEQTKALQKKEQELDKWEQRLEKQQEDLDQQRQKFNDSLKQESLELGKAEEVQKWLNEEKSNKETWRSSVFVFLVLLVFFIVTSIVLGLWIYNLKNEKISLNEKIRNLYSYFDGLTTKLRQEHVTVTDISNYHDGFIKALSSSSESDYPKLPLGT